MKKCEHIYGIGPGYKEQGYYRFMYVPENKSDEKFHDTFDHCPNCGKRLTEEE